MKRKFTAIFLASTMLVGSTMLGGCVKDNESESVTNIREAKAAQLTALTGLSNAQAEAVRANAAADVAIKTAEAAYRTALAAAEDLSNKETKRQLDIALGRLDADIAAAKASAEAALEIAKAELEKNRAILIAALDNVTEAKKTRIKNLLTDYNSLIKGINGATLSLIDYNKDLIDAKYDLTTADNLVKSNTITANSNIAVLQALIAYYKLAEGNVAQQDAAKAALVKANKDQDEVIVESNKLDAAYDDANLAYAKAGALINENLISIGVDESSNPIYVSDLIDHDLPQLAYVIAWEELGTIESSITSEESIYGRYVEGPGVGGVLFQSEVTGNYNKLRVDMDILDATLSDTRFALAQNPGNTVLLYYIERLDYLKDNVTGDAKEVYDNAVVKFLKEASTTRNADLACLVADLNTDIAGEIVGAAELIVYGFDGIAKAIIDAEELIIVQEKIIADLKGVKTQEEAIAYLDEQITFYTNAIQIGEEQATALKLQIDELITSVE